LARRVALWQSALCPRPTGCTHLSLSILPLPLSFARLSLSLSLSLSLFPPVPVWCVCVEIIPVQWTSDTSTIGLRNCHQNDMHRFQSQPCTHRLPGGSRLGFAKQTNRIMTEQRTWSGGRFRGERVLRNSGASREVVVTATW